MEFPNIKGYKILSEIGKGSAGTVYEAQREDLSLCALKVYDTMSSNPALLSSRVKRVAAGEAKDFTVAVLEDALDARPSCVVMPLMAERVDGEIEKYRPRTLQTFFEDYQQKEATWPFLLKLASRLAALHSSKVAHGNLKPGNIFLGAASSPLLADYATGLMPGVHRVGYSDSLLYSPPEQLDSPEGYHEEEGYRWDVYAYGVLSYRLLTGVFPRCHKIFKAVSPTPGTQQRFEIEADYHGIMENLKSSEGFTWPSEPASELEARQREIITLCLSLDPQGRPANMREVSRYFDGLEAEIAAQEENRGLVANEKKALRKKRVAMAFMTLASAVALGLGAAWAHVQRERVAEAKSAQAELAGFKKTSAQNVVNLQNQRDQAVATEAKALNERGEIAKALKAEKGKAQFELASAYQTNEALFNWVLEEGIDDLPILDGRAERLTFLSEKIKEQLTGLAERPQLAEYAGLLRLRQAELLLARGDVSGGQSLLAEVVAAGELSESLLVRARMRLLLITSKVDPKKLDVLLEPTQAAVENVWGDDEALSLRAKAAIELAEARMWNAKGDSSRGELGFLASLKSYKDLAALHPENPTTALLVGRRYLSAATAAEGEGAFDNAAKLREEAAVAFLVLAKKHKNPSPELAYQVASATAAQAVAKWQQGDTFGAEALASAGVAKLLSLKGKLPNDFRVSVDLASQQGIIATSLRDEGKPKEARAILESSIQNLESGLENHPKNWGARYLLASLKWQLAGLMGLEGESDSEFKMGAAACDELKSLLAGEMKRPRPSEVRKSLAYLCGDLGHSADLRNQRDLAVKYLEESKRYWQELVRDEGDQLEFREGYHWANNRISEMKK